MDKLLRVSEVAERLSVSLPRAYELIRRGMLPSVSLGRQRRVDPRALEAFLAKGGHMLAHDWQESAQTGSTRVSRFRKTSE